MNRYKLDRFQQEFAVLVQEDAESDEVLVLRERLEAFVEPGETLYIDFDDLGNIRNVEVDRDEEMLT
ncbi:hypothetical protein [Salimicrobium halophilum]|uniref:Uncharacterized protein n=1 Tax=Salimicrobium halophilum TaxID=86666 RepID=A0A1G8U5Y3_9BACI|nr:hypothetical protein [Salimicrobium halophilum]SDJ49141.1 hypothetical protein SAMN04490247_2062 [Salimicrobium halophilum]